MLAHEQLAWLKQSGKACWLGLSGGVDSIVLAHLLLQHKVAFTAVHINHRISSQSDAWASFCEEWCQRQGVPFVVETHHSGLADHPNLEATARDFRYQIFAKHVAPDGLLLTAHHANDQAETILLRLMRGAGPTGLRGMAMLSERGHYQVYRPLLLTPRPAIVQYAREQQISWVEDESNQSLDYDRNYIRHQIIPAFEKRWPNAVSSIELSRAHIEAESTALKYWAEKSMQPYANRRSLGFEALAELGNEGRAVVIRQWLAQQELGLTMPKMRQLLEYLQTSMATGDNQHWQVEVDQRWILAGYDQRVHLVHGYFYQMALFPKAIAVADFAHNTEAVKYKWGEGYITIRPSTQGKLRLPKQGEKLTIVKRRGGEVCWPSNRAKSRSLKKLLVEWKVPPWVRPVMPLIYYDDELVAIGNIAVCRGHEKLKQGEVGLEIVWIY